MAPSSAQHPYAGELAHPGALEKIVVHQVICCTLVGPPVPLNIRMLVYQPTLERLRDCRAAHLLMECARPGAIIAILMYLYMSSYAVESAHPGATDAIMHIATWGPLPRNMRMLVRQPAPEQSMQLCIVAHGVLYRSTCVCW